MTHYVYRFGGGVSDGGKGDRNLLGGKGANLAEMASIGLPVPPGFTIATPVADVSPILPNTIAWTLTAVPQSPGMAWMRR